MLGATPLSRRVAYYAALAEAEEGDTTPGPNLAWLRVANVSALLPVDELNAAYDALSYAEQCERRDERERARAAEVTP